MYAIDLTLWPASSPWFLGNIYGNLVQAYGLPPSPVLMASLEATIDWPGIQAYYLDSLTEQNRRHLFQIRFKASEKARDLTSVFISLDEDEENTPHQIALRFPARGDRHIHSRILSWMKEIKLKHPALECEFELAGFAERSELRFIRERYLSAFQWEEKLERYLHVDDRFRDISEVKKGYIK